ncbi:MAG: hypothetical protein QOF76_3283, partial [Solirubrobacteraceae bacterium]|nr:hypothetical protein [Solirubrobacteraceae bacterium]
MLGLRDAAHLPAIADWYGGGAHMICGGAGLEEPLRAAGYAPGYAWMRFVRAADASASAPTDLRIEAVGPDRAEDWAAPVAAGFNMPPPMVPWLAALAGRPGWTCLAAYDGDVSVAGAAVFVAGEQAYVGFGATLPAARGRGAQSALLARRVAIAADQGARELITETGAREPEKVAASYRNILRAGFAEAEVRPNWD